MAKPFRHLYTIDLHYHVATISGHCNFQSIYEAKMCDFPMLLNAKLL